MDSQRYYPSSRSPPQTVSSAPLTFQLPAKGKHTKYISLPLLSNQSVNIQLLYNNILKEKKTLRTSVSTEWDSTASTPWMDAPFRISSCSWESVTASYNEDYIVICVIYYKKISLWVQKVLFFYACMHGGFNFSSVRPYHKIKLGGATFWLPPCIPGNRRKLVMAKNADFSFRKPWNAILCVCLAFWINEEMAECMAIYRDIMWPWESGESQTHIWGIPGVGLLKNICNPMFIPLSCKWEP